MAPIKRKKICSSNRINDYSREKKDATECNGKPKRDTDFSPLNKSLLLILIFQVILILTKSGHTARVKHLRSSSVHVMASFSSLFHRRRGKSSTKNVTGNAVLKTMSKKDYTVIRKKGLDRINNCSCPSCDEKILDSKNGQAHSCRSRIEFLMKGHGNTRDEACIAATEQSESPCAGDGIICNPKKCRIKSEANPILNKESKVDKVGNCGCPLTCDQTILDGSHNSQPVSCRRRIHYLMNKHNNDRDTACASAAEQENTPCAGDGVACNPKKCKKEEESQSKKQERLQVDNNKKATDDDEKIHKEIGDCGCPLTCDQTILDGSHNSQPFSCRTRIHHLMKRYENDRDTACASAAEQANSPCAGDGIACNPKKCKKQGNPVSIE